MTRPPRVVTIGETMAVFGSRTGTRLAHGPDTVLGIAGSESNVAIGLRRLGIDVTWVGRVGDDSLGELILRELSAERVTVVADIDLKRPTSLMVKESRTTDDTRVWYYRSGNAGGAMTPEQLDDERLICEASLLHITGISLALSATMAATIQRAVEIARRSNVLVSFDVNYRERLWPMESARAAYLELLPQVDILFASETEMELLFGGARELADLAKRAAALGPNEVVITRGADGAFAWIDGLKFEQAAVPVEVQDTVGAGDAFVAGYLAERLKDESPEASLRTGARAGALACTSSSDWQALPTRRDLAREADTDSVTR
ncbi:sugar kinase [Arthrobacter sp. H5]|uniref:sugar kinase n=1 Tax=Arthrobacter sp. H5 TaxID=1267973 RepID=UPI0004832D47|nr:sugar kinase [Arthrobacter sp. H5]